jgi:hypothetical protein
MPSRSSHPRLVLTSADFPRTLAVEVFLLSCLLHRPVEWNLGDALATVAAIVVLSTAARQTVRAADGPQWRPGRGTLLNGRGPVG